MHVLSWLHTRKNVPMQVSSDSIASLMIRVMMVRSVYPNHKMSIDNKPV
jgi:hypothetical protein